MIESPEDRIVDIFAHHPPDEMQAAKHKRIHELYTILALEVHPMLPAGPGRTVAIRKLLEAMREANSAVALGGKF